MFLLDYTVVLQLEAIMYETLLHISSLIVWIITFIWFIIIFLTFLFKGRKVI